MICPNCNNTGHACEHHPDRAWGGVCVDCDHPFDQEETNWLCQHGACFCGGAGMPCPTCCDPPPTDGRHSILEAFTPRHLTKASIW